MDDGGGYDVTFISSIPNELICAVCTFVLRDPVQLVECGHRLCDSCFQRLKKNSNNASQFICPTDRITIDCNQVFKDKGVERHVLSLQVKCQFYLNGCHWYSDLRNLPEHVEDCLYKKKDALPKIHLRLNKVESKQTTEEKALQRIKSDFKKSSSQIESHNTRIKILFNKCDDIIESLHHLIKQEGVFKEVNMVFNASIDAVQSDVVDIMAKIEELEIIRLRLDTLEWKQTHEEKALDKLTKEFTKNASLVQSLDARFKNTTKEYDDQFNGLTHSLSLAEMNIDNVKSTVTLNDKKYSVQFNGLTYSLSLAKTNISNVTNTVTMNDKKYGDQFKRLTDSVSLAETNISNVTNTVTMNDKKYGDQSKRLTDSVSLAETNISNVTNTVTMNGKKLRALIDDVRSDVHNNTTTMPPIKKNLSYLGNRIEVVHDNLLSHIRDKGDQLSKLEEKVDSVKTTILRVAIFFALLGLYVAFYKR